MDIPSAISTAGSLISLLSSITDAVKASGKAEAMTKVIELQEAVLAMQRGQFALLDENRVLRERIRELEDQQATASRVEMHFEAYWSRRDDGTLDGPFSTQHWDTERKLVRMGKVSHTTAREGRGESIRFVCSTSHRWSDVPVDFLLTRRVWEEKDLSNVRASTESAAMETALDRQRRAARRRWSVL